MPTQSRDALIVRTEVCRIDDTWFILKGCEQLAYHDHTLGDFDTHAQASAAGDSVERAIAGSTEHGVPLAAARALMVDDIAASIKSAA